MEPLLQISHLTKIFSDGKEDEYKAVDDVSFELFPGEKLAIIGESGSGKTTVVNMITRILDSTDGKILLDGEDITCLLYTSHRILPDKIMKGTLNMDISNMNNIESRVQSYWTKRAHNFNIIHV